MNDNNMGSKISSTLFIVFIIIIGVVLISSALFTSSIDVEYEENDNEIISNYKKYLIVNLRNANLTIESGTEFKAESDNSNVEIVIEENKIQINNEDNFFKKYLKSNVTVYIPKELILDSISIDIGYGNVNISNVCSKELNVNFAYGDLNILSSEFDNKTNIFREIGKTYFEDVNTYNLIYEQRFGSTSLRGKLIGETHITTGIGEINLLLTNPESEYTIKGKKSVGKSKIVEENMDNEFKHGNGDNNIVINAKIGSLNVDFI